MGADLNAPPNPMAVKLAALGALNGHDPLKRVIAAHRSAASFDGTQDAAALLATYRKEYNSQ